MVLGRFVGGFGWFQVVSGRFRWFQVVPCFSNYRSLELLPLFITCLWLWDVYLI